MIFYGTKGKHLKSDKISGVKCIHCEQQSSQTVSVFGRYAYLYWIPMFPLPKKGVSECDNCKVTLERKEMNDQLKIKFDNIITNVKTPLTYWIGSAIILIIIGFAYYSGMQHKEDMVTYIDTPKKGDLIEYKSDKFYSTLRISQVTTDSIFVIPNDYEIKKKRKLYKIDKDKNYTQKPYGISKTNFKELFDNKTFLDIKR